MVGFRLQWRSGSAAARRLPKPRLLLRFAVQFFRTWFAVSFQNACVVTFIRGRELQTVSFFIHVSICTIYWTVSIAPPLCEAVFRFKQCGMRTTASGNPSVSLPPGLFSCGMIPMHPYRTLEMTGLWCYDNSDALGGMWHAQADCAPLGPVIDST